MQEQKIAGETSEPEIKLPEFQLSYPPEDLANIFDEHHPYHDLYKNLVNFVLTSTGDRPPSHSNLHMAQVARIARLLYQNLFPEDSKFLTMRGIMVIFAAYLHDVADHKYETPMSVVTDYMKQQWGNILDRVKSQGQEVGEWNESTFAGILNMVSFSKEKKWRLLKLGLIDGPEDPKWKSLEINPKTLTDAQREMFGTYGQELGEHGQIVRDIVSDADQIEAIGLRGVDRCWQYSEELWEKKIHEEGLTDDETTKNKWIRARVVEHYHEKLKILGSEYIKTASGKKLASVLNLEMELEVKKFAEQEGIPWID